MTTVKTTSEKRVLTLVKFKGYLYPKTPADYNYLKDRNYFSFAIPEQSLPFIRNAKLLNCDPVIEDFGGMWDNFRSKFLGNLAKFGSEKEASPKEYLVLTDHESQQALEDYLDQVTLWCKRYRVRCFYESKSKAKRYLYKVAFEYDQSINNAFGYEPKPATNIAVKLNLAHSLRLNFESVLEEQLNKRKLVVSFLEKTGDKYSEFVTRVGFEDTLDKNELRDLIQFLMTFL